MSHLPTSPPPIELPPPQLLAARLAVALREVDLIRGLMRLSRRINQHSAAPHQSASQDNGREARHVVG